MAMRSLGYMPSEVELAIIMQRLDMDGKPSCAAPPRRARLAARLLLQRDSLVESKTRGSAFVNI